MTNKHTHSHSHEKKHRCMLCGKPAPKSICDSCSARVRGEALHKRKKEGGKTKE